MVVCDVHADTMDVVQAATLYQVPKAVLRIQTKIGAMVLTFLSATHAYMHIFLEADNMSTSRTILRRNNVPRCEGSIAPRGPPAIPPLFVRLSRGIAQIKSRCPNHMKSQQQPDKHPKASANSNPYLLVGDVNFRADSCRVRVHISLWQLCIIP